MDRVGQSHSQGFEHLSDELVVTILRKALEEKTWGLLSCNEGLKHGEAWASAKRSFQLRAVCRRFRSLISCSTPNLHWQIKLDQDWIYIRAMQSVRDAGPKLEGLKLTFGRNVQLTGDQKEAAASVPFLASLLWQGHTVNLRTFSLASSKRSQSEEGSHHLLSMLAAQPSLESVYFWESGFDFKSPLSQGQHFPRLVDLKIVGSYLSDAFVQSIIHKAPQLEKFGITACAGLGNPELRGLRLKELMVNLIGPLESLLIDAPSLACLRISSEVLHLKLKDVTKLQTLSLRGPSVQLEVYGGRPLLVDHFSCHGDWHFLSLGQALDHIMGTRVLHLTNYTLVNNAELESLSTFVRRFATQIEELGLGSVLDRLTVSERCEEVLDRVCFSQLKKIELQVSRIEQFRMLHMLFTRCPSLEVAWIDLFGMESPITCLASTITGLQAAFPKVRIEYEEPRFITACHLLDLDAAQVQELQNELE
jgi:hypothetical protein